MIFSQEDEEKVAPKAVLTERSHLLCTLQLSQTHGKNLYHKSIGLRQAKQLRQS